MPVRKLASGTRAGGRLIWETLREFVSDGCPQMAGALSFYTFFSLPPLMVVLIMMIEPFLDPAVAIDAFRGEIDAAFGPAGAAQVQSLLEHVQRPGEGAPLAAAAGVVAFLFGSTAAFAQLQGSLNAIWKVAPDPTRGDVKNFVLKRLLSFAMILSVGFLLLVSMVVDALLAAFAGVLASLTPEALTGTVLVAINQVVSLVIVALLFAAMFRFLPDARVAGRAALVGGFVTALLFAIGRAGLGAYLGGADPGSVYGAAGSLAVVLIWIYYSSMILFWGAEFTQVWARWRGSPIQPLPGAVRIVRSEERVAAP